MSLAQMASLHSMERKGTCSSTRATSTRRASGCAPRSRNLPARALAIARTLVASYSSPRPDRERQGRKSGQERSTGRGAPPAMTDRADARVSLCAVSRRGRERRVPPDHRPEDRQGEGRRRDGAGRGIRSGRAPRAAVRRRVLRAARSVRLALAARRREIARRVADGPVRHGVEGGEIQEDG